MRLLIVEDADRLRRTLEMGLRREGFVVETAADGPEGLAKIRERDYDVVVLDRMLPGLEGLEILRQVRAEGRRCHVLVLTAKDGLRDRIEGLEAGADDYLVKPFAFEELLARIRALLRRRYEVSERTLRIGTLSVDPKAGTANAGDEPLSLTRREYLLLEYLAHRPDEVVTRAQIEDAIYDSERPPMSNAIDSAVCRLRAKLERAGSDAEIRTERGRGYVLTATSA